MMNKCFYRCPYESEEADQSVGHVMTIKYLDMGNYPDTTRTLFYTF